jgi:hypothetical protein
MSVAVGAPVEGQAPIWTAILSALHSIQHQQQVLSEAQSALYAQQRDMFLKQDTMLHRVVALEQRLVSDVSAHTDADPCRGGIAALPWTCPLCLKPLSHRHSFKGHIRRLVNMSSRPKCHLNPRNPEHQLLVHRFEGGDFYARARNFCQHFQAFVSRAISKHRADDASRVLVREWLACARASDGCPFPTCSHGSEPESDAAVAWASSESSSW